MRVLVLTLCVVFGTASAASAGILCQKKSGSISVRETECKKKETRVDPLDLLANGSVDGRIGGFAAGDPDPQSLPSYDTANELRLPLYTTTINGAGDVTAPCRTGDQVVSGGCVGLDSCYVARSYPIINPPDQQSGWHCRMFFLSGDFACPSIDVLSVCLKSH